MKWAPKSRNARTGGPCRNGGFTLVEILVALGILAFGLLAIASMQVSAMRGNAFASSVTEASTWATDRMEQLVNLSWTDPNLQDADGDGATGINDTGFDNDPTTQADADFQVIQGRYSIFWNVADNQVINNTKTVNVIVTWTDHGVGKSLNFQRVIPRVL
ncbi:MAG: prepilin-type N-terminal cleavage/methylation domain-containing protein [Deltaproteobacteria bacterium]|nr:prepilin-type N-terminal cleavage/methylation domain-containing protein [Deltaproteobacteria bacterium]